MVTTNAKETILRLPQVQTITGLSRSAIYAKIKQGIFPAPIKLGLRASGWIESEVYAFIHEQIAKSRPEQSPQKASVA